MGLKCQWLATDMRSGWAKGMLTTRSERQFPSMAAGGEGGGEEEKGGKIRQTNVPPNETVVH